MIKVNDLPTSPAYRVCLLCPQCHSTYSATRGDYFWMSPNKPFRCQNDRTLLVLVRERTVFEPITR